MAEFMKPGAEQRITNDRDVSVVRFVGGNDAYYVSVFERIEKGSLPRWHFNIWGLLIPWIWAAFRGVWLMFWLALAIDVLAITCLMQIVKYAPLLASAEINAAENITLVERYSRWIQNFGTAGIAALILGRIWIGSSANRWYYSQYNRWRIREDVASGIDHKRVVIAVVLMAMIVPITTYRSTQQRLDQRACLNDLRAGETVTALYATHGVDNVPALLEKLEDLSVLQKSEKARLDSVEVRTSAQNSRRSQLGGNIRQTDRDLATVQEYEALTLRDRFDCWFIDDFPTIARLAPPLDIIYRSVPDEDAVAAGEAGATKIIKQVKDPIEGRLVNIFTYTAETIDKSINFLRASYAGIFDAVTHVLRQSLIMVELAFMETPWIVVALLFIILSWRFTGPGTTIFVAASLAFLAVFELWQIAMQTMALVVVATALCVLVGLPAGVWMAKNKWARWITEPILDVMQTIPSLSYLVPAVAFFGISQPPAVIATVVFALPPMVKLTALGIRHVPESTKEAALAFGASHRQLLRKVELPMAIPSIMAGLNQTIMLALSMATISAFIGAEGLGAIVTAALGDAQAGKGLLAGVAIALVAMMIDRILKGIRASFSRI